MLTSDERREVAERLRIGADVPSIGGFTLATLINAALTDGQPMPTNNAELMLCLADLIDPTCHQVLEDETQVCSECGGDLDERYGWSYCPCCGARITEVSVDE